MSLLGLFRDLQSQRLTHVQNLARVQRCRRCHLSTEVLVEARGVGLARPAGFILDADDVAEGHAEAESASRRNAWLSLALSRCVSCGKRPLWAHPLAILATPLWTASGVIGGLVAAPITGEPMRTTMLIGGALALGYGVARRLGKADLAVKRV